LSPDKSTLAVSDTESHDIRFFDTASKTFTAASTLKLTGSPYFTAWSADGKTLYVPTQGPDALLAIPLDGSPSKSVAFDASTCVLPHVVTLVGERLYVVCEGDHSDPTKAKDGSLVILDSSLAIVSSNPLGPYPDAFAVLPGGFQ
jgi:DNA-binding beta-propeller fold protein YncE